jgi:hypothetical protein
LDSKQFDELVARLASTASRRKAVKGVVGGTLASVGVTSVASAKNNKKHKNKEKKKPFCHCPTSNIRTCVTLKLKKKARNNHLKTHPFDRKGACPYG